MRIKLFIALAIILLLLSSITVYSQTSKDLNFSVRLSVAVNGDENLQTLVKKYLTQELNSIGDVKVVKNSYSQWILGVIAHEIKTFAGYKTGVALSGVVIKTPDNSPLILDKDNDEMYTALSAGINGCEAHWLQVGSNQDIEKICKNIVEGFNNDHLEKDRKFAQRVCEISRLR